MTYKFELFLVIQKKKKGLINIKSFKLSFNNFIYRVTYMIMLFMVC